MVDPKIQSRARLLRRVTLMAIAGVSTVTLLGVATSSTSGAQLGPIAIDVGLQDLGSPGQLAGALVIAVVGALFAYGLWHLERMLTLVMRGEVFSAESVRHLRGFTKYAFASTIASLLLPPLAQLLIMFFGPVQDGKLTLVLNTSDLWALLVSGLLFLLARLLSEAQRIAEENRMIV